MERVTFEQFIKRAIDVHGEDYDYSIVEFKNMDTKVAIVHKRCGKLFFQTPKNHLRGHGCPICKRKKKLKTNEEFIQQVNNIHNGKYDYSKTKYIGSRENVCIICPKHGEFEQKAHSHLNGCGCPKCGKENSIEKRKYSTKEFIEKAKETHDNKYDYSKTVYTDCRTKVCIICPKHGEFWQTPDKHLQGCGCPKCGKTKKYTTKEFVDKISLLRNDNYDYSKVEYVNSHSKVCVVCPEHGEFWISPNDLFNGKGCPSCAHKISRPEKELFEFIKELSKKEVKNNVRGILPKNMELDIYLPFENVAIEYNGLYWHSEEFNRNKNYHLNKTLECEKKGIRLIHIFEDEWLHKKEIVKSMLKEIFNQSDNIIDGNSCSLREVDNKECNRFLEENCLNGGCRCNKRIGLYYGEKLVQVMCINKNKIVRNCMLLNTKVINGTKILLKNMPNIVVEADRRWSNGDEYKKCGFEVLKFQKPDYMFAINGKRVDKRKVTGKEKTFSKIYDCGKIVLKYM